MNETDERRNVCSNGKPLCWTFDVAFTRPFAPVDVKVVNSVTSRGQSEDAGICWNMMHDVSLHERDTSRLR